MKKFRYRCLKCLFEWSQEGMAIPCQKCGNLYCKWLNYSER